MQDNNNKTGGEEADLQEKPKDKRVKGSDKRKKRIDYNIKGKMASRKSEKHNGEKDEQVADSIWFYRPKNSMLY